MSSLSSKVCEINLRFWYTCQTQALTDGFTGKSTAYLHLQLWYKFKALNESNAAVTISTCITAVCDAETADDLEFCGIWFYNFIL